MSARILHIARSEDWLAAQQMGEYRNDSLTTEGFIHCSKAEQVVGVANSFFVDQHGLVLLVIDPSRLKSELGWETSPGSEELFPHIHGPLNLEAVIHVLAFEPGLDGKFSLPPLK